MKEVTAFQASDGSLFQTQDQCKDYEVSLLWVAKIDGFLSSNLNPYPSGSQLVVAKKVIIAWERFKVEPPQDFDVEAALKQALEM